MATPALLVLFAYLLGSIPFSFLVGRLAGGKDIRTLGSGNIGATNVARTVGKGAGLIALLLDAAKGFAAVAIARGLLEDGGTTVAGAPVSFWIAAVAIAAVGGHMFPVWLRFRGGKGVATAAGVFLAIDARAIAIVFVVFLLIWISTRFVSLASILAAVAIPLELRFIERQTLWIVLAGIVIAIGVVLKHRGNIARLAAGTEPKFPSRRSP